MAKNTKKPKVFETQQVTGPIDTGGKIASDLNGFVDKVESKSLGPSAGPHYAETLSNVEDLSEDVKVANKKHKSPFRKGIDPNTKTFTVATYNEAIKDFNESPKAAMWGGLKNSLSPEALIELDGKKMDSSTSGAKYDYEPQNKTHVSQLTINELKSIIESQMCIPGDVIKSPGYPSLSKVTLEEASNLHQAKETTASITKEDKISGVSQGETNQNFKLDVVKSDKPMATVSVKLGETINKGNFQSSRIDISIYIPCDPADINKTYSDAMTWVSSRLSDELKKREPPASLPKPLTESHPF